MVPSQITVSRPGRLLSIAFAVLLCLLPVFSHGMAADFKMKGDMYFTFGWANDLPLDAKRKNDRGRAKQRMRFFMTSYLNESLRAYGFVRIAPMNWGQKTQPNGREAGFALDADGVNLSVRTLLLGYQQPDGKFGVSMGIIPLATPVGAFHDGILRTTGAGISASYQVTDWFTPQFFWARPYDDYTNDEESGKVGDRLHDEMDLFGLYLPLKHYASNTEFTPWGMYSVIGRDSSFWVDRVPAAAATKQSTHSDGKAWWAGMTLTTRLFDPFVFKANAAYGSIRTGTAENDFNTRGWQAAFSLDYKLESCMPGLFGWYATGSDEDKVRRDHTWGYTPTLSAGDYGFEPTNFGFYSPDGLSTGDAIGYSMGGTMGFGARVSGISFLPDLTHTIIVAYYQGTNDEGLAVDYKAHRPNTIDQTILTKKDYAFEVNFNHEYALAENLICFIQLGVIDLHRDKGAWDNWNPNRLTWQALTTISYRF